MAIEEARNLHVSDDHHHDGHDDHHHEPETFLTKYIFSQDHKMIAKQFLFTGMFWAIVGALLSVLFRMQLGWPDTSFPFLETILGKWAEGGKLSADFTMHLLLCTELYLYSLY
jgi:cytochrome c oxidase subunit 1